MSEEQLQTPPVTEALPPILTPVSTPVVAQAQADDARSVSSVRSDGNASVASVASVASSVRSGIPKLAPAAMRPPSTPAAGAGAVSKIGRPCTGQAHKPAVPSSPGSIASTTLDNSIILTEDTDSFIIGQRVWVGGTKPGQIAFIGETQFAPGEWAGIVLDQPIGKNDGSVAGHRYFQCEARRGVFSRLTRLTRTPLPGADLMGSGDAFSVASSDAMRARKLGDLRRSPPANGKSPSSIRSPTPLSASNTSLHSAVPELKLGDRVIVSSSQGSKIGTLRYIGFTAFANGEWCGVELDNPVGKNDGSVQGKRYFECLPSYGVFAPLTKVSRSPSKTKPGNCIIHSGAAGASPSLRRVNSRESLASMASSIVSSASGMRRVRLGVTSLTPSKKSANTPPKSTSTPVATRMALQVTY